MKTTREGKRFIIAAFLIAVAAINTGNNLIYLILSLMLSFILLSIVLLKVNLSGVSLAVSVNTPVFAGEETLVVLTVTNVKPFIPAYSVNVLVPDATFSDSHAGKTKEIHEGGRKVYFPLIPSGGSLRKAGKIVFGRRGLYSHGNFNIRSGFPFILFHKKMTVKVTGEILVYPSLRDVEDFINESIGPENNEAAGIRSQGEEIYSIREFRYGDDWRKIHWKASAKVSELLVREYTKNEFRKTTIIIDNLLPAGTDLFEKTVSLSASIAKYFLDEEHLVRILSCKKVIPFGVGKEHLFRILDTLAVIKEESTWDSPVSREMEGFSILVLKSRNSVLNRYIHSGDMVIYADNL
ncbi:MAG: DUF58 domain-containing protein [Nitrospirota bacterium]